MITRILLCSILLSTAVPLGIAKENSEAAPPYQPTAENLAAREEFQDAKFGIFIHWGVYSVLGRGEWVMNHEKISASDYELLAPKFNPTKFDADAWCRLFKEAGANYITITSKHHDGFCMFESDHTDWDIVDRTPYKKDVLKLLSEACQRHGLKLFFYHSQLDWHHSDYFPRGRTGLASERPDSGDFGNYLDYMNAQLAELLDGTYGKVAGIWFDGWWDQQSKSFEESSQAPPEQSRVDWQLEKTYALIHRLQPTCLVGSNHHIAPFPGEDFQMFERDLPGENKSGFAADAKIGTLPLETCDTINRSWGYSAGDNQFKDTPELVGYLVRAAGRNANFLLNVGPRPDGTIDPQSTKSLKALGMWMKNNGETIHGTRGGPVAQQAWGVSTVKQDKVYLHLLDPPKIADDGFLSLSGTENLRIEKITLYKTGEALEFHHPHTGMLHVKLANSQMSEPDTILVLTLAKSVE